MGLHIEGDGAALAGFASVEGSGPPFACWDDGPCARCSGRAVWPGGLRRWLRAPVRKGPGSNPTAVIGGLAPKKKGTAASAFPKAGQAGACLGKAEGKHCSHAFPSEWPR